VFRKQPEYVDSSDFQSWPSPESLAWAWLWSLGLPKLGPQITQVQNTQHIHAVFWTLGQKELFCPLSRKIILKYSPGYSRAENWSNMFKIK
jgi:hypothetical protein